MAQLLLNGLALGAAYALVALGFVLVLNATGAVNFAQGDMVVAGGYAAVAFAGLLPDMPGILLLPLVLALMAGLGLLFSALAYFPLKRRPPTAVFISTIAGGIILQNGITALFGSAPRSAPLLLGEGGFQGQGFLADRQTLAILGVAALLILGQHFLLSRTQLGRQLRATAQDRDMAQALGVPVNRMIALTFALGAALAGAAGLLLANRFFVTPTSGGDLMLKAYIAVAIGGWGSLPGAVLGALLIALFEVLIAGWISYTVASVALYGALLVILFLRPQGLLGEAAQRRA